MSTLQELRIKAINAYNELVPDKKRLDTTKSPTNEDIKNMTLKKNNLSEDHPFVESFNQFVRESTRSVREKQEEEIKNIRQERHQRHMLVSKIFKYQPIEDQVKELALKNNITLLDGVPLANNDSPTIKAILKLCEENLKVPQTPKASRTLSQAEGPPPGFEDFLKTLKGKMGGCCDGGGKIVNKGNNIHGFNI